MPALSYRHNAANRELFAHTRGQTVGVRLDSGGIRYMQWAGFIELEVARAIKNAVPVKLVVDRYSNANGWATDWIRLKPGEFVQGCVTPEGVYGVVETGVRILRPNRRD